MLLNKEPKPKQTFLKDGESASSFIDFETSK